MALLFFEGFETIGTQTGFDDRATPTRNLRKRMTATNNLGDAQVSNMFLTQGENELGFAWHMGQAGAVAGNFLEFDLPDEFKVSTGPESPTFTVGALVFVPQDPRTFTVFSLNHDGSFDPNLTIEDSLHLLIRRSSSIIDRVDNVLTPGLWNYIEWKIKADGTLGQRGTATVNEEITTPLTGPISDIDISEVEMFLPVWNSAVTYNAGDQVRWKGFEYTAEEVEDPEDPPNLIPNLNKEPGVELDFWTQDGPEASDTVTEVPLGSQFYFKNDPDLTVYTTNSVDSTTNMSFTPPLTNNSYIPEQNEEIVFGGQAQYAAQVNDTEVISEVGIPTMVPGDHRTLQTIIFGAASSPSSVNFVAYDNIYILTDQNSGLVDFLGPVRAVSLPPNNALQDDWEPSAIVPDQTDLISENGVNLGTLISSKDNSLIDEYEHVDINSVDTALAVKIETETQNLTAGDPELKVSLIVGANEETISTPILNTGDTEVINVFFPDPPGGGTWDITTINSATIKLQMFSGFGA